MEFRFYREGDDHIILELWNRCLTKDPISARRFRNLIILDENFTPEGCRLAFAGNELIGAMYAVKRRTPLAGAEMESENGWITFFFVHPAHRRKGVGKQLMKDALQFLHERGCRRISFSAYAPNYVLPGLDRDAYPEAGEFLEKIGFKHKYTPVSMDLDLQTYQTPEELKEIIEAREHEGYRFEPLSGEDFYEAMVFADEMNPDWGRVLRQTLLKDEFRESVIVAKYKDKPVGFSMYGAYYEGKERFGPFGVDEKHRGKKLGEILLHLCLRSMKEEGLHGAWFLWTGEKTAAGHLYLKSGFRLSRRFHVMEKID